MRAFIYDHAFKPLTIRWYRGVLEQLPPESTLLDVGVATAGALVANTDLVKQKRLRIHGVDIDADYIEQAGKHLAAHGLLDLVSVELVSIYDHHGGPYDAAYFGASFMLMPDPAHVLRHVTSLLKPGGKVYFTQTFQEKPSPFMERLKPMLKKLTTIDFGQVTYEADFLRVVEGCGLDVVENTTMHTQFNTQSFRRVVAVPRTGAEVCG